MNPELVWTLAVIAASLVTLGVWLFAATRRRQLREQLGPDHDWTSREAGPVRQADAAPAERAKRVERLRIRPLSAADAARFSAAWRRLQHRFVDAPHASITEADHLVGEVMAACGYPLGDFDQRATDISAEHPRIVVNYRAARAIAQRHARGEASTEDLRQALIDYRALFEDLLDLREPEHALDA